LIGFTLMPADSSCVTPSSGSMSSGPNENDAAGRYFVEEFDLRESERILDVSAIGELVAPHSDGTNARGPQC
jgi:hypothetical protein